MVRNSLFFGVYRDRAAPRPFRGPNRAPAGVNVFVARVWCGQPADRHGSQPLLANWRANPRGRRGSGGFTVHLCARGGCRAAQSPWHLACFLCLRSLGITADRCRRRRRGRRGLGVDMGVHPSRCLEFGLSAAQLPNLAA